MKCVIYTDIAHDDAFALFATELQHTHPRSTVELSSEDGKAMFTITAKDPAALRAAFNGVTSILQVYNDGQQVS